jgi:hypothetical protein
MGLEEHEVPIADIDTIDTIEEMSADEVALRSADTKNAHEQLQRKENLTALTDALNDFKSAQPTLDTEGFLKAAETLNAHELKTLSNIIWDTPFATLTPEGVNRFNNLIKNGEISELTWTVKSHQDWLNKAESEFGMNNEDALSPIYEAMNNLMKINNIRVRKSNWADEFIASMSYGSLYPKASHHIDWRYKTSSSVSLKVSKKTSGTDSEVEETHEMIEEEEHEIDDRLNTLERRNDYKMADKIIAEADPDEKLAELQNRMEDPRWNTEGTKEAILEGDFAGGAEKFGIDGPTNFLSDEERDMIPDMDDEQLRSFLKEEYYPRMREENPDLFVLYTTLG